MATANSKLVSSGVDPLMVMQAMNQTAAAARRYQWMRTKAKETAVAMLPSIPNVVALPTKRKAA